MKGDSHIILQIISLIGTGGTIAALAWIGKRTFELGKMAHRLDAVEEDIKDLRTELRTGLAGLNKRIDSLMLAITSKERLP